MCCAGCPDATALMLWLQANGLGPIMTDVVLEFNEDRLYPGELHGVLQCSRDIFSTRSAQRFSSAFQVRRCTAEDCDKIHLQKIAGRTQTCGPWSEEAAYAASLVKLT